MMPILLHGYRRLGLGLLVLVLLVHCLMPWPASAGKAEDEAREQLLRHPKAEALDDQLMDRAMRASLASAMADMLDRIKKGKSAASKEDLKDPEAADMKISHLPFPPAFNRKKVGEKQVTRRFFWRTKQVPNWKYNYKEVEVLKPVREGSEIVVKRVTVKKKVGKYQDGMKEHRYKEYDDKGDQSEIKTISVYGPGGSDEIGYGFYGDNAMAIYVLLNCGLDPEQHEEVGKMIEELGNYVTTYGLPDGTWDVAWLTIAFASYPEAGYQQLTRQLVHKLVLGQITDGSARGMWGPVCVDPGVLAKLIEGQRIADEALKKIKEQAEAGGRINPRVKKLQEKLQTYCDSFYFQVRAISRQGFRFGNVTQGFTIQPPDGSEESGLKLPGLPFNIYREMTADIESTAVATMALRVAFDAGLLQEKIEFQLDDYRGRPLLRPEPLSAVLGRTAAAVARAQKTDGRWPEMNQWQQVTAFKKLELDQLGDLVEVSRRPLDNRVTLYSTACGYATMSNIAAMIGLDKFSGKYSRTIERGRDALLKMSDQYLSELSFEAPGRLAKQYDLGEQTRTGALAEPMGVYLMLAEAQREPGQAIAANDTLLKQAAYYLLMSQDKAGKWNCGSRSTNLSSSLYARVRMLEKTGQLADPKVFAKPKKPAKDRPLATCMYNKYHYSTLSTHYGTLAAMLYLSNDVRPPACVIYRTDDSQPASELSLAMIRKMWVKDHIRPRVINAETARPEQLKRVPVLIVVCGKQVAPVPESIRQAVARIVKNEGVVLIETGSGVVGRRVADQAAERLFADLNVHFKFVEQSDPMLRASIKNDRTKVQIGQYEGRTVAVILPLTNTEQSTPTAVAVSEAGNLAARIVAERSGDALDRDYPIRGYDAEDVHEQRQAILQELVAGVEYYKQHGKPITEAKPVADKSPATSDKSPGKSDKPAAAKEASGSENPLDGLLPEDDKPADKKQPAKDEQF